MTCDFQFGLYDAASGGAQVGVTQTHSISVSNGLFTVPDLNSGSGAFNGEARWLAIAVQCQGTLATQGCRRAWRWRLRRWQPCRALPWR